MLLLFGTVEMTPRWEVSVVMPTHDPRSLHQTEPEVEQATHAGMARSVVLMLLHRRSYAMSEPSGDWVMTADGGSLL